MTTNIKSTAKNAIIILLKEVISRPKPISGTELTKKKKKIFILCGVVTIIINCSSAW
jgi:hypothetical protein